MTELFKNLRNALEKFGPILIKAYQDELNAHNHNASGTLSNSLQYIIDTGDTTVELSLELEDYWKYIESGTEPHWPPVNKILEWIRVKPVAPRMKDGKLPSEKQLAYLISRKISLEGTKGTKDLETAEDSTYTELMERIDEAVEKDIEESVDEILLYLWK